MFAMMIITCLYRKVVIFYTFQKNTNIMVIKKLS